MLWLAESGGAQSVKVAVQLAGKGAVEFVEAELKETLEGLARHLFGQDIQVRWGALLQCILLPPDPVSVGEHVQQMPAAHYGSARVCKLVIPPGC